MFSPARKRLISLSGPGPERDEAELFDPVELVLGDLDAVDHQHAGVAVGEVDGDVVDQARERAVLRADRLDVGREIDLAARRGVGTR